MIDFTALDSIPTNRAKKPTEEDTSGAFIWLDRERQERENARQMYAQHQRNIQRAGTLRSDIALGIKRGADPLALLLKALECISLMTGESTLYTQSRADLLAIYGWGLGQPAPLKAELEDAQHRLAMLTRPELKQATPDAQERIDKAVTAHEELIASLQKEIEAHEEL